MKFRIFIVLISFAFSIKAQHAYFSSLNQNLLSVNPAFAGTNKQLRAQTITGRTNWGKYGGDNTSYYAGVDFLVGKNHGLGLSFNSNVYNNSAFKYPPVLTEMQLDFSYALHLKINDKIKIVPAFQVSYFQITLDRAQIPFDYYEFNRSPFVDASYLNLVVSTKRNMDFSSGLLAYGKRFYAGISVLSITQPDEGLLGVSKRLLTQIYQGKYKFLDTENFNIDVYGFVKLQKLVKTHKAENFIQYGTYLNYKVVSFHFAHRLNEVSDFDAFVAGIAINKKGFRTGYNSKCNYATHLSNYFFNELYLQYSFGRNKNDGEGTPDNTIMLID